MSWKWWSVWLCGLCALLLLGGCSDEPEPEDVTIGCRLNSDCPVGQGCVEGVCQDDPQQCEGEDCPCATDADCGTGQGCDIEAGQCFELECLRDLDCALSQVCLRGRCATDLEADRDRDGVPDAEDVCPEVADTDQTDSDGDLQGDACDSDDDNDAIPDTIDNCPLVANTVQGNADGDEEGNACDDDTGGISVRGALDFSALPGADVDRAQVFISGRQEPVGIDEAGNFVFDQALAEPGPFLIRARWPGFADAVGEFVASDGEPTVEVEALVMTPVQAEDAREVRGVVLLEGSEEHSDIVVRARLEGTLVDTTLSDAEGGFVLRLGPVDHTLSFSRDGYEPLEVELAFNNQGELAGQWTVDGELLQEASLSLVPEPVASVSGQVQSTLGALGDWSSRAFVTLVGQDEDAERRIAPVFDAEEGRGQFQIAGVTPGQYTLSISAQGHSPQSQPVTLVEGENPLDEIITLQAEQVDPDNAVLMRGLVRLAGQPVDGDLSDITVRARVQGNLVDTTVTASDGAFVVQTSRVNHTLSISRAGFADLIDVQVIWDEADSRFEVDGQDLATFEGLVLEQLAGSISVTVNVEPDWVPQGQRAVTVSLIGQGQERSAVANGPPVVFTDLPTGDYIVFADRPGFSQGRQTVTLDQRQLSAATTVNVVLEDLAQANLTLSGVSLTGNELRQITNLRGANLAGVSLTGEDPQNPGLGAELCGVNLSGVSLVGADLTGANLDGADLTAARLDNATLNNVSLRGANLGSASLFGANLEGADLRNNPPDCQGEALADTQTILIGANLSSANLTQARFTDDGPAQDEPCVGASERAPRLDAVRWIQADLSGVHMQGGDLTGANLNGVVMAGAELGGACLRDATLLRADLTQAALNDADLSGVGFFDVLAPNATFERAKLTGANFSGINLIDAVLDNIDARQLEVSDVLLGGTSMLNADLEDSTWVGALLNDVDMSGSRFDGADLRNAQMVDVVLTDVRFVGADLRNALLAQLDVSTTDFSQADLGNTNLNGANLEGTNFTEASLQDTSFRLARYNPSTLWPQGFEFRTVEAFGQETILAGLALPNNLQLVGVTLTNADLDSVVMRGANLTGAQMSGVSGIRVDLVGSDLSGANLDGVDFMFANMSDCVFQGGTARTADFVSGTLTNVDFSDSDLTGTLLNATNLDGAVLQNIDFTDGNLRNATVGTADFTGATMLRVELTNAIMAGTNLTGANLGEAQVVNVDLRGATVVGADFAGASLVESKTSTLQGGCPAALPEPWVCLEQPQNLGFALFGPETNLEEANLGGMDLTGAVLNAVNFEGANMAGVMLAGVNLTGARLGLANLVGADLSAAVLLGADLTGSDLSQADLSNVNMPDVGFIGATLTGVDFSGSTLTRGRFDNTNLVDANFQGADLTEAIFNGADLTGVDFRQATLTDVLLSDAVLVNVLLTGANLTNVSFEDLNLSGTDLTDAVLANVNMQNATLTGVNFTNADLTGADMRGSTLLNATLTGATLFEGRFHDIQGACPTLLPSGIRCATNSQTNISALLGPNLLYNNATLDGLDMVGANLSESDFQGASVNDARTFGLLGCPTRIPDAGFCTAQPAVAGRFVIATNNVNLAGADLRGINLSDGRVTNVDFTGANLTGVDLSNAFAGSSNFTNANLTAVNLNGTLLGASNFTGATLTRTTWDEADVLQAIFTGADLRGVDMTFVERLRNANFSGAMLGGAKVASRERGCPAVLPDSWRCLNENTNNGSALVGPNANLDNLILAVSDDELVGADLSGASLQFTALNNADLNNVDLSNANLTEAVLSGANMINTNLRGANLTEALLLNNVEMQGVDLTGATLSRISVGTMTGQCPVGLPEDFSCSVRNGSFVLLAPGINLSRINLILYPMDGANLTGSTMRDATLNGASFNNADLSFVDLSESNMIGTLLAGANLRSAFFQNVNLRDADLSDADLTGATGTNSATFTNTTFSPNTICPNGQPQSAVPNCGFQVD